MAGSVVFAVAEGVTGCSGGWFSKMQVADVRHQELRRGQVAEVST